VATVAGRTAPESIAHLPAAAAASLARGPRSRGLRKAVRVAIVASAGFLVGQYVFDDSQLGVYAALTAIALLALADFGGIWQVRARIYVAAIATAVPLVVLGTVVSESTLWSSLALFAVAFAVSISSIAGRNVASGANAIILFFVVACAIPAPDNAIEPRVYGVLFGGVMSLFAALLIWPDRPARDFRALLGISALRQAELVDVLAADPPLDQDEIDRRRRAAVDAVREAHPFRVGITERPATPSNVDMAQLLLIHDLERTRRMADRLVCGTMASGKLGEIEREAAAVARDTLMDCGHALTHEGPAPDPVPARTARHRFRVASDAEFADRVLAGSDPNTLAMRVDRAVVFGEMAISVVFAAEDTRVATRADKRVRVDRSPDGKRLEPREAAIARIRTLLRSNLTGDSVLLRNAFRLALGLAVARAIAGAFELEHGFWVVFATLGVMRTSAPRTGATALEAVLGTALGFAAVLPLLVGVENDALVYAIILPVVILVGIGIAPFGVIAAQAGFTAIVAILFNLVTPIGWEIGVIRLLDVAVGASVGLVIGLAVWPGGASKQLGNAVADALEHGGIYAAEALRVLLGKGSASGLAALRRQSQEASRRAADVLTFHLAEGPVPNEDPTLWSDLVDMTDQARFGGDVVRRWTPVSKNWFPDLVDQLDIRLDVLAAGYHRAARALREQRAPDPETFEPMVDQLGPQARAMLEQAAKEGDRARAIDAVRLLRVREVIVEAFLRQERARARVKALAEHTSLDPVDPAIETTSPGESR
jgi:uncharacterized membrane protein YccC